MLITVYIVATRRDWGEGGGRCTGIIEMEGTREERRKTYIQGTKRKKIEDI